MIVEFDAALSALVEAAIPGLSVYGNFEPRADLTGDILARLRFLGFSRQDHRKTASSITQQWAIDLQADQAMADSTVAATMDGYLDDLIVSLIGAEPAGTFDGIKIEQVGAGINDAESALQYTITISFNAVIRRN